MNTITTAKATAKDGFLRFAIRLDAGISGLIGIVGLAIAPRLADLSGTTTSTEYAMSAFFVAYGIAVYTLSVRKDVGVLGTALVAGNVLYAVGAVAVVLLGVWPLTTIGVMLTLGSGVFTLAMADLQYLGLRRQRA